MTFFFSNFGPNTTTFVLPVELFPTYLRGTCHGIAAAAGKIGAVVGTAVFNPIKDAYGADITFIFCGIISILGVIVTMVFIRDGPEDPEVLEKEFDEFVREFRDDHRGITTDDKSRLLLDEDTKAQFDSGDDPAIVTNNILKVEEGEHT